MIFADQISRAVLVALAVVRDGEAGAVVTSKTQWAVAVLLAD